MKNLYYIFAAVCAFKANALSEFEGGKLFGIEQSNVSKLYLESISIAPVELRESLKGSPEQLLRRTGRPLRHDDVSGAEGRLNLEGSDHGEDDVPMHVEEVAAEPSSIQILITRLRACDYSKRNTELFESLERELLEVEAANSDDIEAGAEEHSFAARMLGTIDAAVKDNGPDVYAQQNSFLREMYMGAHKAAEVITRYKASDKVKHDVNMADMIAEYKAYRSKGLHHYASFLDGSFDFYDEIAAEAFLTAELAARVEIVKGQRDIGVYNSVESLKYRIAKAKAAGRLCDLAENEFYLKKINEVSALLSKNLDKATQAFASFDKLNKDLGQESSKTLSYAMYSATINQALSLLFELKEAAILGQLEGSPFYSKKVREVSELIAKLQNASFVENAEQNAFYLKRISEVSALLSALYEGSTFGGQLVNCAHMNMLRTVKNMLTKRRGGDFSLQAVNERQEKHREESRVLNDENASTEDRLEALHLSYATAFDHFEWMAQVSSLMRAKQAIRTFDLAALDINFESEAEKVEYQNALLQVISSWSTHDSSQEELENSKAVVAKAHNINQEELENAKVIVAKAYNIGNEEERAEYQKGDEYQNALLQVISSWGPNSGSQGAVEYAKEIVAKAHNIRNEEERVAYQKGDEYQNALLQVILSAKNGSQERVEYAKAVVAKAHENNPVANRVMIELWAQFKALSNIHHNKVSKFDVNADDLLRIPGGIRAKAQELLNALNEINQAEQPQADVATLDGYFAAVQKIEKQVARIARYDDAPAGSILHRLQADLNRAQIPSIRGMHEVLARRNAFDQARADLAGNSEVSVYIKEVDNLDKKADELSNRLDQSQEELSRAVEAKAIKAKISKLKKEKLTLHFAKNLLSGDKGQDQDDASFYAYNYALILYNSEASLDELVQESLQYAANNNFRVEHDSYIKAINDDKADDATKKAAARKLCFYVFEKRIQEQLKNTDKAARPNLEALLNAVRMTKQYSSISMDTKREVKALRQLYENLVDVERQVHVIGKRYVAQTMDDAAKAEKVTLTDILAGGKQEEVASEESPFLRLAQLQVMVNEIQDALNDVIHKATHTDLHSKFASMPDGYISPLLFKPDVKEEQYEVLSQVLARVTEANLASDVGQLVALLQDAQLPSLIKRLDKAVKTLNDAQAKPEDSDVDEQADHVRKVKRLSRKAEALQLQLIDADLIKSIIAQLGDSLNALAGLQGDKLRYAIDVIKAHELLASGGESYKARFEQEIKRTLDVRSEALRGLGHLDDQGVVKMLTIAKLNTDSARREFVEILSDVIKKYILDRVETDVNVFAQLVQAFKATGNIDSVWKIAEYVPLDDLELQKEFALSLAFPGVFYSLNTVVSKIAHAAGLEVAKNGENAEREVYTRDSLALEQSLEWQRNAELRRNASLDERVAMARAMRDKNRATARAMLDERRAKVRAMRGKRQQIRDAAMAGASALGTEEPASVVQAADVSPTAHEKSTRRGKKKARGSKKVQQSNLS